MLETLSWFSGKLLYWSWYQASRFLIPGALLPQWLVVAVAALFVFSSVPAPLRWFARLRSYLGSIASRRGSAILLCGLAPMVLRALLLPIAPIPIPSVHDEFSHLLLADTLASGRLANAPHPMWRHFESIHIIQQPAYASMYPPAFGAIMALGQRIAGQPWLGVWLSMGLMCASFCWMLQGWFPATWALIGGLVTVATIGVTGFWMNSYIGGAVPATGGALLLGAVPRLVRLPRTTDAVWLAAGLILLINSRPLEGMVLAFVAAVAVFAGWTQRRLLSWGLIIPILAPAGAVLLAGGGLTLFYNLQVTGNPLKMPYQVNRETYGWPENLGILPPVAVEHRHAVLRAMHVAELAHRDIYLSFGRIVDNVTSRIVDAWGFYVGPLLTLPLLYLGRVARDRRTRWLAAIALVMCGLNALQLMLYPQHLAAIAVVIFALLTQGIRYLYVCAGRRNPQRRARFAAAVCACFPLTAGIRFFSPQTGLDLTFWENPYEKHRDARASVASKLAERAGPQLIMVRYHPDHSPHQEWVYNRADIDRSKVVWAREMNPEADGALLKYFANREVWLLEPDTIPVRLTRYPQHH